jgi:hypothetical protein
MPATDLHAENIPQGKIHPADFALPVTPNDGVDLTFATRYLIVSVGGTLKVDMVGNGTQSLTVPAGVIPLRVTRVWATGTAATGITAIW